MASLPSPFCADTYEVSRLLREGRTIDAESLIAARLRRGDCSTHFLELVADYIDPSKPKRKSRGRPRQIINSYMFEIADDFSQLIDKGIKPGEAYQILADKYPRGADTIRRRMTEFRKARREADSAE